MTAFTLFSLVFFAATVATNFWTHNGYGGSLRALQLLALRGGGGGKLLDSQRGQWQPSRSSTSRSSRRRWRQTSGLTSGTAAAFTLFSFVLFAQVAARSLGVFSKDMLVALMLGHHGHRCPTSPSWRLPSNFLRQAHCLHLALLQGSAVPPYVAGGSADLIRICWGQCSPSMSGLILHAMFCVCDHINSEQDSLKVCIAHADTCFHNVCGFHRLVARVSRYDGVELW